MMDQHNLLSDDLHFTPGIKSFLSDITRWGKFLAIVGLILSGLLALFAFTLPSAIEKFNSMQYPDVLSESSKLGITINFLIIAALVFVPCLILLKFSNSMKKSLEESDQEEFAVAFANLKTLFKFYGVLTIIVLALYALAFLLYLVALLGT